MIDFKKTLAHYNPKPLGEMKRYAVLLPLVWDKEAQDWEILYQVRSQTISQPGEVAFPGGRVEVGESYEQAAIRETTEELNISASSIEVLGEIDYLLYQGSSIHCFVAVLSTDWRALKPNPDEVDRLFTIRLTDLLSTDPKSYHLIAKAQPSPDFPLERLPQGADYNFGQDKRTILFYDLASENLWGMTANFTYNFIQLIKAQSD